MRIHSCLFLIVLLLCLHGFCQSKPAGPVIATPNATAIAVQSEVPVSFFTGLPSVEIPLYTFNERGLELPLSLSYNAQGFRPDLHPSWVGANWSLQAGGTITRKLNNLPDEWFSTDYLIYGYYYNHQQLNNPNWSLTDTLATAYQPLRRWYDKEPDEFTFSFMGFSGRFFLDHAGKWRVQSNKSLRLLFDEADLVNPFFHNSLPAPTLNGFTPKVFGKFILVDEAGIQYIFGKTSSTDAIEYSSSITPPGFNYRVWLIATSWHLAEIRFPDGTGQLNISYERGPFQSSFSYFESQNRFFVSRCEPGAGSQSNFDAKGLSGTVLSPVYPFEITTTSGIRAGLYFSKSNELAYPTSTYLEVFRNEQGQLPSQQSPPSGIPADYFSFMLARNEIPYYIQQGIWADGVISQDKFAWFKLDSIVVTSYDLNQNMRRTPFKRFAFQYRENAGERLKLLSVHLRGTDATDTPLRYDLEYNDWGSAAPSYVSELTDHWGFANNKPLKRDATYGGYDWFGGNMLQNREPDETAVKTDILTRITYPTGGSSSFEYEANRYAKYVSPYSRQLLINGEGQAGGLRIKQLHTDDGAGHRNTRSFFYVKNYTPAATLHTLASSGVLDGKPSAANYNYSINMSGLYLSLYSSNSIVPLSANSGALCTYSEVTERMADNSWKTWRFTNHDNGYADLNAVNSITPAELGVPARSRSFERGQLLEEKIFTAAGKLVQHNEYSYTRLGETADTNFIRSLRKEFGGYCISIAAPGMNPYAGQTSLGFQVPLLNGFIVAPESFNPAYTTATAYGYFTYKFLPEKITRRTYPSGALAGPGIATETTTTYDADGLPLLLTQTNSRNETITTAFKYPYHFAPEPVYQSLLSRQITGLPIETAVFKNGQLVQREKTVYDFFNNNTLIKPHLLQRQIANGALYTDTRFNRYDEKGNLLEMVNKDGLLSSYVWSYFKTRPVAQLTGLSYAAAEPFIQASVLTYPAGGHAQLLELTDQLRNQLPQAQVTSFLYDASAGYALAQAKDLNGQSNYYNYDNMGRLTMVRDDSNHILKQHEYQYRQQASYTYRNAVTGALFHKAGCPTGYDGVYYYEVPEGRYGSFISQADANQQAQQDIITNGQAMANTNAVCTPYYNYASCCGWGATGVEFILAGNNTVNFSLTLTRLNGSGSVYNVLVGNLSGQLFLPTANRTISFSAPTGSGQLTITPTGQVYYTGSATGAAIVVTGVYAL